MKKIKLSLYCLLATVFCLLSPTQTKAQDDAYTGIYIDGTFVDKIDCWSFDYMYLIFPVNEKYKKYDKIFLQVKLFRSGPQGKWEYNFEGNLTPQQLADQLGDAKYGVWKFFKEKNDEETKHTAYINGTLGVQEKDISFKRSRFAGYELSMFNKLKFTECYEQTISFSVSGGTFDKYEYDALGNKVARYSNFTNLCKPTTIVVNNCKTCPWDINAACQVTGKKVNFKIENSLAYAPDLGLIKDAPNSNTTSNTTTDKASSKTETPVKTTGATGKTIITTVAPTSATAVKPLDKTKPGYFEEKSDDKKYIFRNGYQKSEGVYHGEVREYDNNQLYKIIMYTDGIEDGLHIIFDDGKVSWSGNYKNGKKDGAWKHYKNGVLEETEKYINGEKQD